MKNKQMISMLTACIFMWCAIAGSIMIGVGARIVSRASGIGNAPPWNLEFEYVSAGGSHSLGITADGRLFAWGNNANGRLGDGTTTQRSTPVHIMSGTTWSSVSAGWNHSIGITTDGRLFAWGWNSNGQLGDGTSGAANNRSTPVQIMSGTTFSSVSAGNSHSLGITTGGRLFAWGNNANGHLGDGTTTQRSTPVHIMSGTTFSSVSAGSNHSLGITTDGRLFTWGNNGSGELGDGTTTHRETPVHIMSGTTFSSVAAGWGHSLGITTDGRLFAWGMNADGRLGDGTTTQRSTPVHIMSETTFNSLSAVGVHSLGITTDGRLFAWGSNDNGQLGDGTSGIVNNRSTPVHIMSGTIFSSVSAGLRHSIGITSDGRMFAWGFNEQGRLGDGTTTQRTTPTLIAHSIPSVQDIQDAIDGLRNQLGLDRDAILAFQDKLNDFMDDMLDYLDGHDERLTALETRMTAAEKELDDLGEDLEKLQEAIEVLEDIEKELDEMQTNITNLNRPQLIQMIEDLETMLEDMQKELDNLDFLEDSDLNPIRQKLADLELALENIDIDLSEGELRTELQIILTGMLEVALPNTLLVIEDRITIVERDIQGILYQIEEIIADMLAAFTPTPPTYENERNNDMLIYLGIGALALGVIVMIGGTSIAVMAGRKKR